MPGSQPKATCPCPFSGWGVGGGRRLSSLVSPWMAEHPPQYTFPHKAIDAHLPTRAWTYLRTPSGVFFFPLVFLLKLSGWCFPLGSFLILAKN